MLNTDSHAKGYIRKLGAKSAPPRDKIQPVTAARRAAPVQKTGLFMSAASVQHDWNHHWPALGFVIEIVHE